MDKELAARVLASISATNAEAKKYEISWFHGEDVAGLFGDKAEALYVSLKRTITSAKFWPALIDVVEDYFRGELSAKLGLEISEISEEGIAAAIGKRAGFELRSLHDADIIQADLMRVAADRIAEKMGWNFKHVVTTPQELYDELVRHAAAEVEKRVRDLSLGDLMDVARTVEDVKRWAAARIEARTGIPLNDISSVEKTQASVLRWADAECRRRIGTGGDNPEGLKMTKVAIRNRLAQRKFYAAHGDRHVMPSVKGQS